MTVAAIHLNY